MLTTKDKRYFPQNHRLFSTHFSVS